MGTLGSNRKTRGGGASDPVGFRFYPTPEELVDHYLKLKKQDKDFKSDHIAEFDVCNFDPWDLAARIPSDDMVWYFFSRKDYKYINSNWSNRSTPGGHWKITGKERAIKARRSKALIGKKRTLTFYQRCQPKPKKTDWVMHEFYLIDSEAISNSKLHQKDFVLCRMKKNSDMEDTSIGEVELGSYSVSNVEDYAAAVVTPELRMRTVSSLNIFLMDVDLLKLNASLFHALHSQDYSSSTFLSSGYIELGDIPHGNDNIDDCNAMQSPFGYNNYSYPDKNDISTCDEGEPPDFTMSDFENEVPDHMSQEVCPPREENLDLFFYPPQPEDYTLEPLMNLTVGNVLHDNNYIACNEFRSPI